MSRHAWTVVCEKSIVDQDTHNVSLDVLEQLTATVVTPPEEEPGVLLPLRIEVVSLWCRDQIEIPERGRGRIKLVAPPGDAVGRFDFDIDLTENIRCRTRGRLPGLPVPSGSTGVFTFVVEMLDKDEEWSEVARIPLQTEITWTVERNAPAATGKPARKKAATKRRSKAGAKKNGR